MLKRALNGAAVAAACAMATVVGLAVNTFGINRAIPSRGEDLGHGRSIGVGRAQSFVIETGPGAVALIDTGGDPEAQAILAELRRRHLNASAVKAIFLTHGLGDATAGIAHFPEAALYASPAEVDLVEGRAPFHSPFGNIGPSHRPHPKVTRTFADGEVIQVGWTTVRAFYIPGNTPGSAAYLSQGVLYLGNAASARWDGRLRNAAWAISEDTVQARASLGKMLGQLAHEEVRTLAFNHSGSLPSLQPLRDFVAEGP